ncbi:MAG TPA: FecR family protein [Vulgatibacter sp.]
MEASILALRAMSEARPPASAEARIVRRALAARQGRERAPLLGLRHLSFAAGLATVAAGVFVLSDVQAPEAAPLVAEAGDSIHSAEAPTSLAVGRHRVLVAPGGSVRVEHAEPNTSELRVEDGLAHFEVEHLSPGQSFKVRTDQVLVEVVGTRFSVEATGSCSEVTVDEGRVRVGFGRGERTYLGAGESRRFCGDPAGTAGAPLLREALVLLSGGQELERAAGLLAEFRAGQPDRVLDEEALYHLCIVKARLGRADEARALADEFMESYPGSERAERLGQWLAGAAAR